MYLFDENDVKLDMGVSFNDLENLSIRFILEKTQ